MSSSLRSSLKPISLFSWMSFSLFWMLCMSSSSPRISRVSMRFSTSVRSFGTSSARVFRFLLSSFVKVASTKFATR